MNGFKSSQKCNMIRPFCDSGRISQISVVLNDSESSTCLDLPVDATTEVEV